MLLDQALNTLFQAAQIAAMPAQAHQQCIEAYNILQEVIKPILENQSKTV